MSEKRLKVIDVEITEYDKAYRFQKEMLKNRQYNEIMDSLILVEHFPCYTLGRDISAEEIGTDEDIDVYSPEPVDVFEVDRGGGAMYHGPGQLVAYPVFLLNKHDINSFLKSLEEVCIRFLRKIGLGAYRKKDDFGVWIANKQVCFIGIGVSHWISFHGLAININPDMEAFKIIDDFSFNDNKIGSVNEFLDTPLSIKKAKRLLTKSFCEVFNYHVERAEKLTQVA